MPPAPHPPYTHSPELVRLLVDVCAALPADSRILCLSSALKWNKVRLDTPVAAALNPQPHASLQSTQASHAGDPCIHLAVAVALEQSRQYINSFAHFARSGDTEGARTRCVTPAAAFVIPSASAQLAFTGLTRVAQAAVAECASAERDVVIALAVSHAALQPTAQTLYTCTQTPCHHHFMPHQLRPQAR